MKFTPKELISVGVFTAVYVVVYLIFNLVGAFSPIAQLFAGLIGMVVNGIVFMLFLTRIQHFGPITVMALILGVLATLGGDHAIIIVTSLVAGLLADVVASRGGYRSPQATVLAYGVFCLWVAGAYLPLLFMRDEVLSKYRSQLGEQWAHDFDSLFSPGVIIGLIIATCVAGLIGGFVGRRTLSRHFERAGLA